MVVLLVRKCSRAPAHQGSSFGVAPWRMEEVPASTDWARLAGPPSEGSMQASPLYHCSSRPWRLVCSKWEVERVSRVAYVAADLRGRVRPRKITPNRLKPIQIAPGTGTALAVPAGSVTSSPVGFKPCVSGAFVT